MPRVVATAAPSGRNSNTALAVLTIATAGVTVTALGVFEPVPGALPPSWMPTRWVSVASNVRSPRSAFFDRPSVESVRLATIAAACFGSR